MLKIKDDVDLKKLGCNMNEMDILWNYKELLFYRDTREIFSKQFFDDICKIRLDLLYDLIKADLIEKVDD